MPQVDQRRQGKDDPSVLMSVLLENAGSMLGQVAPLGPRDSGVDEDASHWDTLNRSEEQLGEALLWRQALITTGKVLGRRGSMEHVLGKQRLDDQDSFLVKLFLDQHGNARCVHSSRSGSCPGPIKELLHKCLTCPVQ